MARVLRLAWEEAPQGRTDNLSLIATLIEENPRMSRRELSEITGFSPAFVTKACNRLLDAGLIQEVGVGASGGGRKPVYLEKNAGACQFLCIMAEEERFTAARYDYACNLLSCRTLPGNLWALDAQGFLALAEGFGRLDTFQAVGISIADNLFRTACRHAREVWEDRLPLRLVLQKSAHSILLGQNQFCYKNRYADCVYLRPFPVPYLGIYSRGELVEGAHGEAGTRLEELGFSGLQDAIAFPKTAAERIARLLEPLCIFYDPEVILLDLLDAPEPDRIFAAVSALPTRCQVDRVPYRTIGLKGLCAHMAAMLPGL